MSKQSVIIKQFISSRWFGCCSRRYRISNCDVLAGHHATQGKQVLRLSGKMNLVLLQTEYIEWSCAASTITISACFTRKPEAGTVKRAFCVIIVCKRLVLVMQEAISYQSKIRSSQRSSVVWLEVISCETRPAGHRARDMRSG